MVRSTLCQENAVKETDARYAQPGNAEHGNTSELPVDSDHEVEVAEVGVQVNCHLDTQLDKLNLTNDTAG